MTKQHFVIIESDSFTSLNELIRHYLKRRYVVNKIWYKRHRWWLWVYTYYAKLELKRKLTFNIGPISTRQLPQKSTATFSLHANGGNMRLVLTDIQQVVLDIKPVTAAGNPAPVDGTPTWDLSDQTLGTLNVAADGLSATFVTSGKLGSAQINVTADADMGEGVKTISGMLEFEVVASEAASLGISAGTPTNK